MAEEEPVLAQAEPESALVAEDSVTDSVMETEMGWEMVMGTEKDLG